MGVVLEALTSLWTRGRLKANDATVGAMADAVEDLKASGRTVITESWPGTAVDTLPQWHDTLGVAYDPSRAVADQQTTLAAMMTAQGGVAILKFQNQIQKEFPLVTVEESTITGETGAAECGVAVCGLSEDVVSFSTYRLVGSIPTDADTGRLTAIVRRYGPAHMIPTSALTLDEDDASSECGAAVSGVSFCGGVAETPSVPVFGTSPYIAGVAHVGNTLYVYTPDIEGVPTPALTYQWKLDGVDIPGGNSVAFIVTESGSFTVEVTATNSAGSTMEETAALVTPDFAPTIASAIAKANGTYLYLDMVSDGRPDPTFGYQWKVNGVDIGGETGATLSLVGRSPGSYTCEVTATNSEGAVTLLSGAYVASVPSVSDAWAIYFFDNGVSQVGTTFAIREHVTSGLSYTVGYEWYKNGVLFSTLSGPILYPSPTPGDEFYLTVTATNPVGSNSVTSETITY